jgi:hypothetical protein
MGSQSVLQHAWLTQASPHSWKFGKQEYWQLPLTQLAAVAFG